MSERLVIQYTQDREWVGAGPDVVYSGPVISVRAAGDNIRVAHAPEDSWRQFISPTGTFDFTAPRDTPTQNWTFNLYGLPRIADQLQYDMLAALMGEETSEAVRNIAQHMSREREGGDDLSARERSKVVKDMAGAIGTLTTLTIATPDLNRRTEPVRRELLDQARLVYDDVLVVSRSLLIAEPEA